MPLCLRSALVASVCAALCEARSLATMSEASCAAFTESCLGITRSDCANSAMASCSREASDVAKFSRWIERALDAAAARHHARRLERALDGAERVVQRALDLV